MMNGLKSMVFMFLIIVLVACSNSEKTLPVETATPIVSSKQEKTDNTTSENTSEIKDEEKEEFDESLLSNPTFNLLQETMTNLISSESLKFSSDITNTTFFVQEEGEEVNHHYYESPNSYVGELTREGAYVELTGSNSYSIGENGSPFLTLQDWLEYTTQFYLDPSLGNYAYQVEDDTWYFEPLSDEFKTIENIEDIVNFFLAHLELVTYEEITDPDDFDYGKYLLRLELPTKLFDEHFDLLTQTFFNGHFDRGYRLNMEYVENVNYTNHYLGLIINSDHTLSSYFVSYNTTLDYGNEDDYYSFFMRTEFYDYNLAEFIPVPEEAIANAIPILYE